MLLLTRLEAAQPCSRPAVEGDKGTLNTGVGGLQAAAHTLGVRSAFRFFKIF